MMYVVKTWQKTHANIQINIELTGLQSGIHGNLEG